jgi:hypothetical protein
MAFGIGCMVFMSYCMLLTVHIFIRFACLVTNAMCFCCFHSSESLPRVCSVYKPLVYVAYNLSSNECVLMDMLRYPPMLRSCRGSVPGRPPSHESTDSLIPSPALPHQASGCAAYNLTGYKSLGNPLCNSVATIFNRASLNNALNFSSVLVTLESVSS